MDGEPLMDSESIGDVKRALEGFPALADVVVVGHDSGQAEECLIGYDVPSGSGLAGRVNAAFEVRITMADLFKAPTVAVLDRRLGHRAGTRK
jgi:hypothetical protein